MYSRLASLLVRLGPCILLTQLSACNQQKEPEDPHARAWTDEDYEDSGVSRREPSSPWGTWNEDRPSGGCEVTTSRGLQRYTTHVDDDQSTISIGALRENAELEDGEVHRVQGFMRTKIGMIEGSRGTVLYTAIPRSLSPVEGTRLRFEYGIFSLDFYSAGCSEEELLFGAIHLAYMLTKTSGQ